MPFTYLAHQGPILPLKRRWPRAFSLTALCVGSAAPDLEYIPHGPVMAGFAHSPLGQFSICLPFTVAVTVLVEGLAAPAFLRRIGGRELEPSGLAWPRRALMIVTSALVGSWSHVFIDGITHAYGFLPTVVPWLQGGWAVRGLALKRTLVLQYGLTLAFGILCLPYAWQIAKHAPWKATPKQRWSVAGVLGFVAAAGAGVAVAVRYTAPFRRIPQNYFVHPGLYSLGYTVFVAMTFAFAAVLGAASLLGLVDALRRRSAWHPPSAPVADDPVDEAPRELVEDGARHGESVRLGQ